MNSYIVNTGIAFTAEWLREAISLPFKVLRGDSWHSGAMCVQTYYRNGLPASWVDFAVGFRCVKSAK